MKIDVVIVRILSVLLFVLGVLIVLDVFFKVEFPVPFDYYTHKLLYFVAPLNLLAEIYIRHRTWQKGV